jgi:hypothetical protein
MVQPSGFEGSLMAVEVVMGAMALTATRHSFSEVMGAGQVPAVMTAVWFTTLWVIRELHGHSMSGLSPVLRLARSPLSVLFVMLLGRNVGL